MSSVTEALDRLVKLVDAATAADAAAAGATNSGAGAAVATAPKMAAASGRAEDAIDAVLGEPRRGTQTVSLRESAVVQTFRDELTDGLIRIDTLNQLLRLVATVLERVLAA